MSLSKFSFNFRSSGTAKMAESRSASLIERLHHVDVEPALDQPLLGGDGRDHLAAHTALVKRCHALLAVEQQLFRFRLRSNWCALDGAISEDNPRVDLRLERHQCAHRESPRHRGDEAHDAFFFPDPTALEVRQLQFAVFARFEQRLEQHRVGIEGRFRHFSASYLLFLKVLLA